MAIEKAKTRLAQLRREIDETYGVNDGGFLQLKTPGVFYGDKEDDHKIIKDRAKRRKKTSSTGNNVFERPDSLDKTPLREKIRLKQRDKLFPSFFSPD